MLAAPSPRSVARRRNPVRPIAGGSGRVHGTTACVGTVRPSSGLGGRWSMDPYLLPVRQDWSPRITPECHTDEASDATPAHRFRECRR